MPSCSAELVAGVNELPNTSHAQHVLSTWLTILPPPPPPSLPCPLSALTSRIYMPMLVSWLVTASVCACQGHQHGGIDTRSGDAAVQSGPPDNADLVAARLPSGILSGFGGMLPAPGFSFSPPSPSVSGDGLSASLGQKLFPSSYQTPQPPFQWPPGGQGFSSLNPQSPTGSGGQQQRHAAAAQLNAAEGYHQGGPYDSCTHAASNWGAEAQQQQQQSRQGGDASVHDGDGSVRAGSAHGGREASAQHPQHACDGDWSAHGVRDPQCSAVMHAKMVHRRRCSASISTESRSILDRENKPKGLRSRDPATTCTWSLSELPVICP